MEDKAITKGIVKAIVQLIGMAIAIWLLWQLQSLIIYLGVAAVLTLIGRPLNKFLMVQLRFKSVFATTITLLVILGLFSGLISLFVPLLTQQSENLSLLDVTALEQDLDALLVQLSNYFKIDNALWRQQLSAENLLQNVNFELLPQMLNQILDLLGGFTIGLFSVVFILFFFLKDSNLMERMILTSTSAKSEARVAKSMETIKNLLSRYFLGIILQISILLIIYTTVLLIFGVENAFVIAFLCALLNIIPYLGPIVGGVLMLLLTMSSFLGSDFSSVILPKTIYVMLGFIFGQMVDNFFSQPFIFSTSVKSHPLEIFIVILAAGTLVGPMGMIVAIPVYTALKVILKEFLSENRIVKSLTEDL
ncbi:MAG: AI-2E family transporter [Flavobacteriaceae bacterium]